MTYKQSDESQMHQVVKVLDLNKKLKYFGEYLQVEYQTLVKKYPQKTI